MANVTQNTDAIPNGLTDGRIASRANAWRWMIKGFKEVQRFEYHLRSSRSTFTPVLSPDDDNALLLVSFQLIHQ